MVKARYIYHRFELAIDSCSTYNNTAVAKELLDILEISDNSSEKTVDMDDDMTIPKHGHNNPKEAAKFMEDATKLLDRFVEAISGFNRYKLQDAYTFFVHDLQSFVHDLQG